MESRKDEFIARKTLIAEKDRGGFQIPDVEARNKACELEKISTLRKLENPTKLWHQFAVSETGTRIKEINKDLYKNMEPHKYPTPKKWTDSLELCTKIDFDDEQWQQVTHKSLYNTRQ